MATKGKCTEKPPRRGPMTVKLTLPMSKDRGFLLPVNIVG